MPLTLSPRLPPGGQVDPSSACSVFTRPANYMGLCAVALPTGLTTATANEPPLPTSMQVICRAGDEALALRIAAAYEAVRGALSAEPPLAHPPFRPL